MDCRPKPRVDHFTVKGKATSVRELLFAEKGIGTLHKTDWAELLLSLQISEIAKSSNLPLFPTGSRGKLHL